MERRHPPRALKIKFSFVPPESLAHVSLGASKLCINPPPPPRPKLIFRFICSEGVIIFSGRRLEELQIWK